MIKNIKSSLFAKVFLVTVIMLLCISLLVFAVLAWLMPQTYSNRLNMVLDERAQSFVSELEQVPFSGSGGLFDQFIGDTEIYSVELYDRNSDFVPLPTKEFDTEWGVPIAQSAVTETGESSPVLSNHYYFSFSDSNARYTLVVYGEAEPVRELQQSFIRIFPFVLFAVLTVAFVLSWLYSRMITKPVLEISRISEKMSDLQNANRKLEADMEHEKELEQARTNFFSAVSHELKTPVTIIKGQLEGMLLGIGAYKDREKYLARALEITGTLETMVQEILTISRLETAKENFKKDPLDCVSIIKSYLNETEDLIVGKDLKMQLDVPPSAFMTGNKMLMEKVFSNLIGNAIKYSPQKGVVRISVFAEHGRIHFSIENTGVRIPEDSIPKLFDPFYRVEQSRNRKTGGSGLGLYIVQEILRQHGSECTVCNTQSGVKFSFTI